jgi:hypothetical protein
VKSANFSYATPSVLGVFVFDDIGTAIVHRDTTTISMLGPEVIEFQNRRTWLNDPNNEKTMKHGLALYYEKNQEIAQPLPRQTFKNQEHFLAVAPDLEKIMARMALEEKAMTTELGRALRPDEHAPGMSWFTTCFCYLSVKRAAEINSDYMNRIGVAPTYVGRRNVINPLVVPYMSHSQLIYLSTNGDDVYDYMRGAEFQKNYEGYDLRSLLAKKKIKKIKTSILVMHITPFKVEFGGRTFSFPGTIFNVTPQASVLESVWGLRGQEATRELGWEHKKQNTFVFQSQSQHFKTFVDHFTAEEFAFADRFARANHDMATIAVQLRNDRGVTLVSGFELYGYFDPLKKCVVVLVVEQKNIFSAGKVTFFLGV